MIEGKKALFTNDSFYQVFRDRNIDGMENLWSQDAPLLCIHPGQQALTDRADIMNSWRAILGSEQCPDICFCVSEIVQHNNIFLIVCREWVDDQPKFRLLGTNGYIQEGDEYRMIFHQSGPVPPLTDDLLDFDPGLKH